MIDTRTEMSVQEMIVVNRRKLRSLLAQHPDSIPSWQRALRGAMLEQVRGISLTYGDELLGGHRGDRRSFIIKPVGEGCNYRCAYCFHHEILEQLDRMSTSQLTSIYRAIYAQVGSNVRIYWHGGEPTLAGLEFFKTALELQLEVFGHRLENTIQTNGSQLDDRWIKFLLEHRFSVGISLDGGPQSHDRFRRSAGDYGTYESTVAAMDRLRAAACRFGVIGVATRYTLDAAGLYDTAWKHGAAQVSSNPATSRDLSPDADAYGNYVVALIDAWLGAGGEGPSVRHVADFLGGLLGMWQPSCRLNGSCSHFVQIKSDGQVKGCCDRNTSPLEHPATYLGNITQAKEGIFFQSPASQAFRQLADQNPETCNGCQWLTVCRGGCSHQRLMDGGRLDAHDPYCGSYKLIFAYVQSVLDRIQS